MAPKGPECYFPIVTLLVTFLCFGFYFFITGNYLSAEDDFMLTQALKFYFKSIFFLHSFEHLSLVLSTFFYFNCFFRKVFID